MGKRIRKKKVLIDHLSQKDRNKERCQKLGIVVVFILILSAFFYWILPDDLGAISIPVALVLAFLTISWLNK